MSINIGGGELKELKPRILVLGVGGAGGNAINGMIEAGLQGVEFIAVNTDAQDLKLSKAKTRIQIGLNLTKGLGAGAKLDIGQAAADESLNEIVNTLQGANMVFIAAGMGGGTGTGAAHVIARAAKELNILTVGVVTLPFLYEGPSRMRRAQQGLEELRKHVDTIIVIPNQNLFKIANEQTTFEESFNLSNNVLRHGVQSVTDLMVRPGIINLDFADVETVMASMGKAMMGTGEAEGEGRAMQAAEMAISNPLIDDYTLKGAKGVLVNITGGKDLKLFEVDEAVNKVRSEVDPEAELIIGAITDESLDQLYQILSPKVTLKKNPRIVSEMEADVWFEPELVIEIVASEITQSPIHKTALDKIKEGTGLALRFPKFTGKIRTEKNSEDASTDEEVIALYKVQKKTENQE